MKKILFVAALVGMSYLGMAQNAPKKAANTQNTATTAPASLNGVESSAAIATDAVTAPASITNDSKGAKKECSAAEKKQCGTEKKGKACCSSKKAANQ